MKQEANLSIDLKRGRLRIHKSVLHSLGDPLYIQLLVNPTTMAVAVRRVDHPQRNDAIHKITNQRLYSDFSYEIYSNLFCHKLIELVPSIDRKGLFRVSGGILESEGAAVFDLRTLRRIDS